MLSCLYSVKDQTISNRVSIFDCESAKEKENWNVNLDCNCYLKETNWYIETNPAIWPSTNQGLQLSAMVKLSVLIHVIVPV